VLGTATAGVVTFEAAVVVITFAGVLTLVVVDNGGDVDVAVDVLPDVGGRPMPASMGASINATIEDSLNGNGVVSGMLVLVDDAIDVVVDWRIIFPTRPLSSRPTPS
jgi:hypothetical protein